MIRVNNVVNAVSNYNLSVCLFVFSLFLSVCLSVYLSVCLSLSLCLCLSLSLSVCLSISLSLSLPLSLSPSLSVSPPSVFQSVLPPSLSVENNYDRLSCVISRDGPLNNYDLTH